MISERAGLLKSHTKELRDQSRLSMAIAEALKGVSFKEAIDSANKFTEALDKANEAAQKSSENQQSVAEGVAKGITKVQNPIKAAGSSLLKFGKFFPVVGAAAAGFVDGALSGFKFIGAALKSVFSLAGAVASGFLSVAKSIISIPFRMLDGLIAMSNKLAVILEDIARATEEVRKQFGDISSGPGKAVGDIAKNLSGSLSKSGLNGTRVFGFFAEKLRYVNEVATGMGATFEAFQDELTANAAEVFTLGKALGLSAENMGSIALRAKAMGTGVTKQLTMISKYSRDFGKTFGISSKNISRDVGMMIADVRNFGNLGPKELAKVSVYARKLGLDAKKLLGVIDQFDTFESAAVSSAKLSQAFGANVDAIKMMKAESPAERIDMLREAFFRAGKSAEGMNRQQLKLLAQTTGLDEETAKVAFSMKNQGASMADLEKQGKLSEKRQLSAAEATMELTKSVEMIIKPFKQFKDFLTEFANGFVRGIGMQNKFRGGLNILRQALRATFEIGMAVGEAFVSLVGPIGDSIDAFKNLLEVGKKADGTLTPFSELLLNIKESFVSFFSTIEGDSGSVLNLFDRLKKSFEGFFGSMDSGKFTELGKRISKTLGNVFAGLADVASKGIVDMVNALSDFIKNPKLPETPGGEIASNFLNPIIKAFDENGPKIWAAIKNLFEVFWEKHKKDIKKLFIDGFVSILKFVFSIAVLKGVLSAAFVGISSLVKIVVIKLAKKIPSLFKTFLKFGGGFIVAILGVFSGITDGIDKFGEEFMSNFGSLEGKIGAAAAGILDTLTFGLLSEDFIKDFGVWIADLSTKFFGFLDDVFGKDSMAGIKTFLDDSIMFMKEMGVAAKKLFDPDEWKDLWKDFTDGILIGLKPLKDAFVGFFKDALIPAFESFKTFLDDSIIFMKEMGLAVKKLFDPSEWKNLGKDAIDGILIGLKLGKEAFVGFFKDGLQSIKDVFKSNSPSKEGTSIGKSIVEGIEIGIKNLPNSMSSIAGSGLSSMLDAISLPAKGIKKIVSPAADIIKEMISESNAINGALSSIDGINIDARLQQLAKDMGIDSKQFEIKHKDFKVVINLNVTMDSDKVAGAVVLTKKVVSTR